MPAYMRGQYFLSSKTNRRFELTAKQYSFNFSMSFYVRLEDLSAAGKYTLFSKSDSTYSNNSNKPELQFFVDKATGYLGYDVNGQTLTLDSSTGAGVKVTNKTWAIVGFSVKVNSDAVSSSVLMWVDDVNYTSSSASFVWIETTAMNTFIGGAQSGASSYIN